MPVLVYLHRSVHVMPGNAPEYGRCEPVCMSHRSVPHARDGRLIVVQENNEMSGSRGEANFVWKCKNCKVWDTEALMSLALRFGQRADGCFPPDHSGSHRPQSRRHPNHTSRESRPSRRLSSILTAEDWNSPSFTLK